MMDLDDLEYVMNDMKLLGSKGTTGTQASLWNCSKAITKNADSWIR